MEQHTTDVVSEAMSICDSLPATCDKYQKIVGKDLRKRIEISALYHDIGKENIKWQTACQADYVDYCRWREEHSEVTAKDIADYLFHEGGKHLRACGIRHELVSLEKKMQYIPMPVSVAIAAHHTKLGLSFKDRWIQEGHKDIWNKIESVSNEIIESEDLNRVAASAYEYDGVRGMLQLADHRASAKEDGESLPVITPFEYVFPFSEKRGIQKLVEEHWKEELLLVRAPTGAGKTDASLLWALKQIENKRADRLIIAMPTRFTSNALSVNVSKTLSATGLYHSSAWFAKYNNNVENGSSSLAYALKELDMARLLETPITVCTIDHLLMSLTLTREDHHLINFNMANSCLVIDEADFYDDFTQANINFLLTILSYWHVPVLIMSASLPESVIRSYKKTGYHVTDILEDKSDYNRVRFAIESIFDYNILSDLDRVIEKAIESGNAIFYMNTVDNAIKLYRYVVKKVEDGGSRLPILLYHSRFTELDKLNKENQLLSALGKDAWQNGMAGGIAILTQIGEMSINISADMMVSEICPIDRLTQRAGRLCRFDAKKIGQLYVVCPQKKSNLYPAPYGSYDRKDKIWKSCSALDKTVSSLVTGEYSMNILINILNSVYNDKIPFTIKARDNAETLRSYFIYNWLIRPREKTDKEDIDTNFWKSRDIEVQSFVFVREPSYPSFRNYSSFYKFKLENAIELPLYLVDKGRKLHRIDTKSIKIGEYNIENIDVVRDGFYLDDIGVNLIDEEGDVFL
ncbi:MULTISPECIES: CRISPR-associated helicase Cas3' [Prevotella]|uniref:CRISPR-associated helicase Cas3' n=1 Tax=Prevotella TaxID=838 RepID=UPI001E2A5F76|nr:MULTISPECIES: CRISPR-associated helicase Cas3' [Prevotella]